MMSKIKIATVSIVLITLLAAAIAFVAPVPADNKVSSFHAYLAISLVTACFYVGGAIIFSMGLRDFTPRLKRAYRTLAIGFSLLGMAFVQLPLVIYGGAMEMLFEGFQLTAIAFVAALLAIFGGTRALARLFTIKNITTSWWFALLPPVVLSFLYSLLPHAPITTPEIQFDLSAGFNVFNMWIALSALLHVVQVKRIASVQYTNALAWLVLTFSLMLVSVVGWLIVVLPAGDDRWFTTGVVPLVPLVFAGMCFLRSAYAFNTITSQERAGGLSVFTARNFFGNPLKPRTDAPVKSVDIVIYAANLVSDPRNIDPILDRLRRITASTTKVDDQELRHIYLDIENYLLTKESVRVFTQESLRQTIANGLRLVQGNATFWSTL